MHSTDKIIKTYNATAANYAATRIDELSNKPLDRLLLTEFASINKDKGLCGDFGCGPGQTTKFIYDRGVTDIIGVDISPEMVMTASKYFPSIKFEVGDLLALPFAANHFSSAIAFYAVVHFDKSQLAEAFEELHRVLKNGGQLLLSFHVGKDTVHFDKADDIEVDIDVYFWETSEIVELLESNNFKIIDAIERLPYPGVEWATKRGYVWVSKNESA